MDDDSRAAALHRRSGRDIQRGRGANRITSYNVCYTKLLRGLVLYWLVNNVLSIAQQWYITRQVEAGGGGGKA